MTNTSSYPQAQVAGMLADQTGMTPSTGTARHYGMIISAPPEGSMATTRSL